MICQEVAVGQEISGQGNLSANDAAKVLVVVFLCLVLAKGGGETYGVIIRGEGNEAFVERLVIEC